MEARVFKISESGKSILVGVKASKYSSGYDFAWCSNPDGITKLKVELKNFPMPKGKEEVKDDNKVVKTYADGSPVMKWVF